MKEKPITRLNCSNCQFLSAESKSPVEQSELNKQGGIRYLSKAESERAKSVKLITLPGKMPVRTKAWCNHSEVDQWVTERMWCRRWEAPGTIYPSKT